MEIVCPDCDARYAMPDEQVRVGRRVRCARCGRSWTPVEEPDRGRGDEAAAAQTAAPPAGTAPPLPPARPAPLREPRAAPPRRDRLAAVGWVLTVLVLILLGVVAWRFRLPIEQAWPPSVRVYHLFGR